MLVFNLLEFFLDRAVNFPDGIRAVLARPEESHPRGRRGLRAWVIRELFTHSFRDELLERLPTPRGSGLRFAEQRIGNFQCRLHIKSQPYLWVSGNDLRNRENSG